MRNGCEAQNPISFFGFSRLHVFPKGKREHRGGADEQNGGIDDLAGLVGCAAHAEQDGDAPEDHDKAEGEDAPAQTGGGRHGTLKDSAKGQEKQSKVDEGEQPDHADAGGGGVRKARLETGGGQGYGVQEEVNDSMDGEGLFHRDLLFRVDRYVYAVLYHIYSCLSRDQCKYMQRESFRIEPPRERGRLIASPTTNAILRRGGLSPPETKKQHPPKAGAVIFSNIRLKNQRLEF